MNGDAATNARTEQELRRLAISRLAHKRDFRVHLGAYLVVNVFLVVVWAVAESDVFWPIFPILGWGIGVAANAWAVYWRKPFEEEEIRREAELLRG